MKRVSLLLTLFAAFAFFMASCGGSETPKAEEATTQDQAQKVEEQVAEETTETEATTEEAEATETEVATEEAEADVTVNIENGKAIYEKSCFACHNAGVAGAAKLDDKARWEATAAKGIEKVDANVINGFTGEHGVMPAKGGNATFTDQEVKDAVAYMLNTAGVTAE